MNPLYLLTHWALWFVMYWHCALHCREYRVRHILWPMEFIADTSRQTKSDAGCPGWPTMGCHWGDTLSHRGLTSMAWQKKSVWRSVAFFCKDSREFQAERWLWKKTWRQEWEKDPKGEVRGVGELKIPVSTVEAAYSETLTGTTWHLSMIVSSQPLLALVWVGSQEKKLLKLRNLSFIRKACLPIWPLIYCTM